MSGAARSEGGKAIIALHSSAETKAGRISTIVLDDFYGHAVTTPHQSVTHVVTEYGTASLRGKTESERAIALIKIAHPDFRKRLLQDALAKGLINARYAAKAAAELERTSSSSP
jgi:acyl-CoA hydrolase